MNKLTDELCKDDGRICNDNAPEYRYMWIRSPYEIEPYWNDILTRYLYEQHSVNNN